MQALRLTPKMKLALERLYETSGQSDFVAYSTALALEQRHLVSMSVKNHSAQVADNSLSTRFRLLR
jgi:hypothetical protein